MASIMLNAPRGSNRKKRIVGRGRSSGCGKTSGRGHNGQKARSGGGVRPGFEGGQMPLFRRVASRGFSNQPFRVDYVVVNLASVERVYNEGEMVDFVSLVEHGLVKKSERRVKILGSGEISKKLNFFFDHISSSARQKIEKAGGTVSSPASSGK